MDAATAAAAVLGVLATLALLALMALTAAGARRRRTPWARAVLAGVFFPVAWIVWYAQDELPQARYQTSPSRQSQAIGASRSRPVPPST